MLCAAGERLGVCGRKQCVICDISASMAQEAIVIVTGEVYSCVRNVLTRKDEMGNVSSVAGNYEVDAAWRCRRLWHGPNTARQRWCTHRI